MCLTRPYVGKFDKILKKKKFYKVVIKNIKGKHYLPFQHDKVDKRELNPLKFNKWYKSTNETLFYGSYNHHYPSGFHCFVTRSSARAFKKIYGRSSAILEVKLKGESILGWQNFSCAPLLCIVSKNMFIIRETR